MTKGIKGFVDGHKHSDATKKKIGDRHRRAVEYTCDYCNSSAVTTPGKYKRKKRHFCSLQCYADYRRDIMPKKEQNSYKGGGLPDKEKRLRIKARSDANHALRDGKLKRSPCSACGREDAEMHHSDYSKPLQVKWLCVKCHQDEHNLIFHQHPELLK